MVKIDIRCLENLKNFKTNNGFTLLELVVSLSVIAILSTIGIASFVSQSKSATLQAATSEVVSEISLAKSRASSQVNNNCKKNGQTLKGYEVLLDMTGYQTYWIYEVCSTYRYKVSTFKLPKNVTFNRLSVSDITFPILTNAIFGGGTIEIDGFNLSKTITVDQAGIR